MVLVAAVAAAVWGAAMLAGWQRPRRWLALALLLAVVILLHLVLPAGHALRRITGGDARGWIVLLGGGLVWAGYAGLLRRLRARAAALAPAPAPQPTFSDAELSRYARHMILREIGGPGQKRLKQARVLVVGAGGLGSPVLLYLAAAGVGTIGIVDDDTVDLSNLQRQVIHTTARAGQGKAASAAAAIAAINPHVTVQQHALRLSDDNAAGLIGGYDLILDGTDSFSARYAMNAAAVRAGIPLIGGALTQWEGQVSVWDPARGAPCYACIFPEAPAPGLVPTCAEAGVLGPLPGVIGTIMASEAIKILTGAGDPLRGRLMIWDALYAEARVIAVERRADCPVCGGH